ncbi:putative ATP-dependent endonuclease of OLD family [Flavobacterium chryseum]|uniref:AAA family ATPase n=1 Tax=Flavobacterium sp. P3160 TaxID=2512113 RepID=UPI00105F0BFF|nr:AAA family ATPase [Flavobacterium sp. P3160]TDO73673.1 putative ATP-dependent endonuclease of OLD family [Flavobacterium sp. P3160]
MKKTYDLILDNKELFKDYFLNDENESLSYFPNFNSINIIIGANNCGKSRFIRNLMKVNRFVGISELLNFKKQINDYNNAIEIVNEEGKVYLSQYDRNRNAGYTSAKTTEIAKVIRANILINLDLGKPNSILDVFDKNQVKISQLNGKVNNVEAINFTRFENDFLYDYSGFKKYYIPTLRSAHSLFQITKYGSEKKLDEPGINDYEKVEKDIFLHTYLKNYKIDKSIDVFTGLHLYREILNSRNSEKSIRNQFEKFEKFLSINFFDGKQIDIVAKFDKNDNEKGINESELILIHVDGEKDTRKLYELGDGIQALIILMYKIFMAEDNSFIYIDEPELNLHPGMQRLFLEQITNNEDLKKKNLRYIITTHSNHFLDLTIEKDNVSIYSFSPRNNELNDKQFIIKNVNGGDNSLLKELGVNNSSVFMANCSIWVEGISDRNYIKAFLKSYIKYLFENNNKKYYSIKEDIDFAFFEYAGSNIDHYIFDDKVEKRAENFVLNDIKALSISNRIFLLADSDASKKNSKKGIRLRELEDAKTDNFIPKVVWNIREIENLLTNEIWKEILIDLCNKTLVKSHKDQILVKIDEVLSEIDSSNFTKEYVGEFLEELRKKMGKISSTYILNQSTYEVKDGSFGTIINKRELSELVFNNNFSWEILSKNKDIENLTIEIYNFIAQK